MKHICNNWEAKDYPYINFAPDESVSEETRAWQGCPSIESTKNGRLFAAWFTGGEFEPCINNYNVLAVSDDKGESWSKPILTIGTDYANRLRKIDLQLWVSPQGHLWLMWTVSPYYETSKPASIKEALDGILPDYQCEFPYTEVMICRDPDADILVWEKPRTLCEGFTRNKPIQTASGRIVVPAYEYEGREYTLRLSDDGGNSFFTATATGKPSLHVFDELCVYEKAPNVLRFLARTSKNGYLESTSLDNGNSWSGATQYEDAPSSRCYIGKLKNGMVAYARNVSDKKRTGMKICLSSDGGDTFAWQMTIDERELVSYPDVADDGQGNIYVIYDRERDNRNKLNRETGMSEAAKEILLCKISFDDVKSGELSAGSFVQRVISKARLNSGNRSGRLLLNATTWAPSSSGVPKNRSTRVASAVSAVRRISFFRSLTYAARMVSRCVGSANSSPR